MFICLRILWLNPILASVIICWLLVCYCYPGLLLAPTCRLPQRQKLGFPLHRTQLCQRFGNIVTFRVPNSGLQLLRPVLAQFLLGLQLSFSAPGSKHTDDIESRSGSQICIRLFHHLVNGSCMLVANFFLHVTEIVGRIQRS